MCGISGFAGIKDPIARINLVSAMGLGIDNRGGDASGYVNVDRETGKIHHAKRVGTWFESKRKFQRRAALGDMCIMHARWATCGNKKSQDQAHPFEIKRKGQTLLFGAHNGVIYNARDSAKKNNREASYTVDSKELFELLADGDLEGITKLDGYGVITWYEPGSNHVKMIRLSSHSEIVVVSLKTGGIAWASTWDILQDALEFAELEAEYDFAVPDIGRIYQFRDTGVYKTSAEGIMFDSALPNSDSPEDWEAKLMAQWEEEQEEKDRLEEAYFALLDAANLDDDPSEAPRMFDEALRTSWERDEEEFEREYPSIAAVFR